MRDVYLKDDVEQDRTVWEKENGGIHSNSGQGRQEQDYPCWWR